MKRLFFGARIRVLPVILVLFACLYGYLMKPDVAGFLYDDGMYLMAAKSLATGQGYRLGEIFGQPLFYKYPPLYPALLAGLMLATPAFPTNIVWLKLANIALGIASLGLLYYYAKACLRLPAWLSIGIVVAMGTNWRFIEASTELMSEPVFMALSMLLLVLSHRFMAEKQSLSHKHLLVLILLSAAVFYARTMGLVLIMAVCLWIYRLGFPKKAFLYASGCGVLTMPWLLWCATKPDTTYPIGHFLVRTFQETYFQSFRSDLQYEANLLEIYSNGVRELLGNFSVQCFPLLERFFLSKATLLSEGTILLSSFAIGLPVRKKRPVIAYWHLCFFIPAYSALLELLQVLPPLYHGDSALAVAHWHSGPPGKPIFQQSQNSQFS